MRTAAPNRLAPSVASRAVRPHRASIAAAPTLGEARPLGGIAQNVVKAPRSPLSVFRSEASGLFSSSPAKRAALVGALGRVESIVEHAMSLEPDPDRAATLDLGRCLLADIGRRLTLLRSGSETSADAL